jgi:hypothetical protein
MPGRAPTPAGKRLQPVEAAGPPGDTHLLGSALHAADRYARCVFIYDIIGEMLVGPPPTRVEEGGHTKVYENVREGPTKVLLDLLDTETFTLGHNIISAVRVRPGSDLYKHERAHVTQYEVFGAAFLPLYGVAQIPGLIVSYAGSPFFGTLNPYAANTFEWAAQLGLPPEQIWYR